MTSPAVAHGSGALRVLFVIPGDGEGSSMIFVRRQAQSVASQGGAVDLFFLGSRTSPRVLASEFRRFRVQVTQMRPAVVHAHFGTVTALFSALACGSLPLLITYRGSDLNPPPGSYGLLAKTRAYCGCLFSQLAALRAQKIVCVSGKLRDRLWWKRNLVAVLPTGVDPEVFRPAPRLLARRRLGWNETERVILFNAGRDPRVKRLDLALAAVDRARRQAPELRMEILDGKVMPDVIPDMMNAADCLLLTSVSEGSPTVVQEALASDLPIVGVDVGDMAERLHGVRDATLAAADAELLGRAIAHMVDPPRRSNGSSKVAEFSSENIARKLKQMYEELA